MKLKKLRKLIKEFRQIKEEGFGGSGVGGGAIAGAGIGPQGEPGVQPKDQPGNKKKKNSPVISNIYKRVPPKI